MYYKYLFWGVIHFIIGCQLLYSQSYLNAEERIPRSKCFFGIHMDIHATMEDKNIGIRTTPEMINGIIDMLHPDYLQIDCKGHPGVSSYPTKAGLHGGSFVGDPLRVWRDVTKKRGVGLFMHYSGVWDTEAIKRHPDWAVVNADGTRSDKITSLFGPYKDKLLIPQLLEVAREYQVDGIWLDGECWATLPDYGEKACKEFTQKTGITVIPKSPTDPNWTRWQAFHRDAFRNYLRYYINALHREVPDLQIASNWAFTDHLPEPVCANVDFISGDIIPTDGVNTARFSSRYIQSQGKPWDLMAWSAGQNPGNPEWIPKQARQFEREAACVLAQGGGFQACFPQNHDGSMDLKKLEPYVPVAPFCRERQEVCFQSTPIPQLALILPSSAHYQRCDERNEGLFPWSIQWQRGILIALLENQYSVEIYNETTILPKLKNYPIIVICEWPTLDDHFKTELVQYVQSGGNLLLVGEKTILPFKNIWDPDKWKNIVIKNEKSNSSQKKTSIIPRDYVFKLGAEGSGHIAYIPESISESYRQDQDPAVREFIGRAVREIFAVPIVKVIGSPFVDVVVRRTKDGRFAVHLINVSGPHSKTPIFDDIEPIGPLDIQIKMDKKPRSVSIEPGKKPSSWRYEKGVVHCRLEHLAIHNIIVVDDRPSK